MIFCFDILVPHPTVHVTALSTQTVGQSLTLQCEVTTVRGITSRVDIVWSSGGTELNRTNDVSSTTMGNSLVYTDSYTISQLSTTDDDRMIHCQVVINASQLGAATVILDMNGESIIRLLVHHNHAVCASGSMYDIYTVLLSVNDIHCTIGDYDTHCTIGDYDTHCTIGDYDTYCTISDDDTHCTIKISHKTPLEYGYCYGIQ